jgi:hypothetical protein
MAANWPELCLWPRAAHRDDLSLAVLFEGPRRDLIRSVGCTLIEACPPSVASIAGDRRRRRMIVMGIDPHKATHTACAVDASTGELRAELTVSADRDGHDRLLVWARGHGRVLLFALEDCRHVSSNLERLLLARGEEVVRVPPHIAAGVRKRGRQRGKSDTVDAMAVARAALQEPDLPRARLAGIEREVRLLGRPS